MLSKIIHDEESKERWEFIEKAAEEVRGWPDWKKAEASPREFKLKATILKTKIPTLTSKYMQKFRKKPVIIEAMQWLPEDPLEAGKVGAWLQMGNADFQIRHSKSIYIETLEGTMSVRPGNWIIKGIQGEFYPCKPDIFAATYEAAD